MANVATHRRTVHAGLQATQTALSAPPAAPAVALPAAEIAALALSLAHLGTGPQATTARRALRALLDPAGPAGGHDDVVTATLATLTEPLDAPTADRARVVAAAITEHRVVRLCYGDAGANVTIREVEPVTCLVHRDHWYLVGWCRLRRGVRAFRFDRILAVESTGLLARHRRADHYLPFQRRTTAAAA
ncbi:helix-turn-helix transcriptional regulator [Actinomadura roseirufa]|uniref:helix-turn-helix transcriptional regulator n=1 Tax=Actinomadura roseirufa TaxID=2094049 RepID=UPI0010418B87|nr:WYL domain-containing protein [Actinomadura roseirufa]